MKRKYSWLAALSLVLILCIMPQVCTKADEITQNTPVTVEAFTDELDYSEYRNWLYHGIGEGKEIDVFLIPPTVDTKSYANSVLNEKLKRNFNYASNQQFALYGDVARVYAPYYRQASINAYSLSEADREQALSNAYRDISASFRYYLDHFNEGRPVILAGFSQGADMCYRILQEYYGGDEGQGLRDNLVAVYAIGWGLTEDMANQYPQMQPAKGETDTGVIISWDCEDGTVKDSFVVPSGSKMLSINPLNWRIDSKEADASLNLGTVKQDSKTGAVLSVTPGLYGAYIDPNRGTLVVTGIDTEEYPAGLSIFPEGSLHPYDNFLFFANLKKNISDRITAYQEANR